MSGADHKSKTKPEAEVQERLGAALDMISDLAKLKFDTKLELTGDNSVYDGISAGLNMLSEELQYSVVSISELEKSDRDFRSIFEQGAAGVVFFDSYGKVIRSNSRYAEFHGLSASHLNGRTIEELTALQDRQQVVEGLKLLLSGELQYFTCEIRIAEPLGSYRWCLMNSSHVRDEAGETVYFVAIFQDITETKNLQATLINASKMTALGEMASGIAHEINNPLGIIRGKTLQLARKLKKGSIDLEHFKIEFEKIEETSIRIAKIIQGLRSFSRNAQNDPMKKVSISEIVQDTIELCGERFEDFGIDLQVKCNPEMTAECRGSQISQVLMNLLGNAHDAVTGLQDKWVRLEASADGQFIELSVTDSGPGIPTDTLDKMMQPFFSTKEVGKGTGLGLSISKGIIEDHEGEFYYDRESRNTRFVVKIPIRQNNNKLKAA
jgi:PAS domain S-box-containing protein